MTNKQIEAWKTDRARQATLGNPPGNGQHGFANGRRPAGAPFNRGDLLRKLGNNGMALRTFQLIKKYVR